MHLPEAHPSSSATHHISTSLQIAAENSTMNYFHQLLTFLLAAVFLVSAVAAVAQQQKSVIVTFPSDTPSYILDQAKDAVTSAGGMITHEYKIIKYVFPSQ
jgi:hypothetical protein